MRAHTRRTVVRSTLRQRRMIKAIHRLSIVGNKGNMPRRGCFFYFYYPKNRLVIHPKSTHALCWKINIPLCHKLGLHAIAQRRENRLKKRFCCWIIRCVGAQVVNHSGVIWSRDAMCCAKRYPHHTTLSRFCLNIDNTLHLKAIYNTHFKTNYFINKKAMSQDQNTPISYKDAGVDIDAADSLIERIKPHAKHTLQAGVLGGIGGFGALFEVPKQYKEPVLVSGTDGVGTKLKLAFEWDMHDTIGHDLVGMSVNDILVQGAKPLFFLDYFSCGKLHIDTAERVVKGIAQACELSDCSLIGGETAEMPGMYPDGEYDLAGFAVGVVEKSQILTGDTVQAGDVVLGLASNGVHSNGFSLVRKCIDRAANNLPDTLDGKPFKEAIMAPTRLYVRAIHAVLAQHTGGIHAMAHITGGGLLENLPRVLPSTLSATLDLNSWATSDVFAWLQQTAGIDDREMNRTFNNGIGMALVVNAAQADAITKTLTEAGETVYRIGTITPRTGDNAVVLQNG